MARKVISALSVLLLALVGLAVVKTAVIGVDFGGEFIKASTISPGKSFSIVEDTTSKRKTPSAIAFYNNERIYEWAALVKKSRAYQTTFQYLLKYLGKPLDDAQLI